MRFDINFCRAREVIGYALTMRQWQMFIDVIGGLTVAESAEKHGVSERLINASRFIMRGRLGFSSNLEVLAFAVGHGMVAITDVPPLVPLVRQEDDAKSERARRAYDMRQAGASFREITEELDYKSVNVAYAAVIRERKKRTVTA